jgi:hypothetical protein
MQTSPNTPTPAQMADEIVDQFRRYETGDQFHALIDGEVVPFICLDDMGCALYAEADDENRIRRNVDGALVIDEADLAATWEVDEPRDVLWLTFGGVRYIADGYTGRGVHVYGDDAEDDDRDALLVALGLATREADGALTVAP